MHLSVRPVLGGAVTLTLGSVLDAAVLMRMTSGGSDDWTTKTANRVR